MRPSAERRPWARALKGVLDRVVAGVALLVAAPVLALIAGAVWIDVGRPVLFRQLRPGLHGVPFPLVKFRTMRTGTGTDGERLTRLGRFLRSCSLDELPELWNVLRGEMSLVGPRPLLPHYLERYSPEQARRHLVRPGITGWAQVRGRNAISWEERLEQDVWYVDHWSLALDAHILARTLGTVLRRQGITAAGSDSMPEFQGRAVNP
jgi:sugar transferase EpsL